MARSYFCCREHQLNAWPKHKSLCKIYAASKDRDKALPAPESFCGICGLKASKQKLTSTDWCVVCASSRADSHSCGQAICDDHDKYQLYSYARTSCARNHARFTICGAHHAEEHSGRWQDCDDCRTARTSVEDYVWRATNHFNFLEDRLSDPPAFEPTPCDDCGTIIRFGCDGYSFRPNGTKACFACSGRR